MSAEPELSANSTSDFISRYGKTLTAKGAGERSAEIAKEVLLSVLGVFFFFAPFAVNALLFRQPKEKGKLSRKASPLTSNVRE